MSKVAWVSDIMGYVNVGCVLTHGLVHKGNAIMPYNMAYMDSVWIVYVYTVIHVYTEIILSSRAPMTDH